MKWYNFETMFTSLAAALKRFLRENAIQFETSGAGQYIHFEIYASPEQANKINNKLDELTIWCAGVQ